MLTGDIRNQINSIWDSFWSGGISNPLEVMEQITYLLFLRRLDDLHTLEENKSARLKRPMERRIFPEGNDDHPRSPRPYDDLRWSRFKHFAPKEMYSVVSDHVFPFLRTLGGDDSTYAHHMKDARFTIPTASLLAKVVDLLDRVPMEDRDTKGDLYEYMLGKIASAGQNGQFRTPRHIIQLMVELTAPQPGDVICDPACGTAGFLVAAGEYLRVRHPGILHDAKQREHFHHRMFHGFDFDNTMLRIGSMNMLLHGVESPDIRYRDSLAQDHAGEDEKYTLVLANPPFAGSLDYENVAKDLLQVVKTKKTELLFLTLFLRLLKPGGRAAVIVPDGVLFGSSKAHKELRRILVEEQKLDAVISLPGGVFKPYAGVSTAILIFTKTNSGSTDNVWFYDVTADGWSLDDKRTPLLAEEKLGPVPTVQLSEEEHVKNNLPDMLARWQTLVSPRPPGEGPGVRELDRPRTAQSFCVPKADIAAQGEELDRRFLYHYLRQQSVVDYANSRSVGANLPRLSPSVLAKFEIPLPPLPEQRRIAEVLDKAEELRAKRRAALNHLDRLKRSIFVHTFGDPAVNPHGWPSKELGALSTKFSDGPFGSNLKSSHYTGEGIRVIRLQNIGTGEFVDRDKAFISKSHFESLKKHECLPGDILVGTLGDPNLRACIQPDWLAVALNKADCVQLRANEQVAIASYICSLLNHPSTEKMAQDLVLGQTRLRISMGRLKTLKVPVPPLSVQHQFAQKIVIADRLEAAHRASLAELDALFASLQHRAFRGEL